MGLYTGIKADNRTTERSIGIHLNSICETLGWPYVVRAASITIRALPRTDPSRPQWSHAERGRFRPSLCRERSARSQSLDAGDPRVGMMDKLANKTPVLTTTIVPRDVGITVATPVIFSNNLLSVVAPLFRC